jgi:hypothetical protein
VEKSAFLLIAMISCQGSNPVLSLSTVFHWECNWCVCLSVGNGKIDFGEFLILVHNYERPLPEDVEMREMFNALDKDRNGYIDRDELKRSFAELGLTLTDADVEAMMNEADVHTDRIFFEGQSSLYRSLKCGYSL